MNKDQLYTDLKKQILTLVLEPGTSLDEQRLSESYSISRTPLREIFRKLAGEGYLDIVNNRGASVSSMNHKVLRDFFITAPMLYAAIGRLAAQNAKPQQIESMKAAQKEFQKASNEADAEEMVYWNDQFHSIMGEMADNPYLLPSYNRLLIDHARISQTFYRPRNKDMVERVSTAVGHHDAMIGAIESGDSERMVELIVEHWELSHELMEYFVRPDPLPISELDSDPTIAFSIPGTCFSPRPDVESAVVSLPIRQDGTLHDQDAFFGKTVRAAFAHRRKTVTNSFRDEGWDMGQIEQALEEINIQSSRRAESVSVEEFKRLAQALRQMNPGVG